MSLAAVLFDNDGLTLDTEPAWTRAETTLFARHGSTFTIEHKRSLLGTAPPVAAAKLEAMLGVPGDQLNAELHELVLVEVAAGVEPMPGAVDLLGEPKAPVGLTPELRPPRQAISGRRSVRRAAIHFGRCP
jgi:beta-phosphoglucomutase-like phosphatase (HAD superfamily)